MIYIPPLPPSTVRQWKKDIKSKYAALVNDNERLKKCLGDREEDYAAEGRFEAEPTDGRRAAIIRITRKTTAARARVVEGKSRRRRN